ncbi:TetR family transcriptional regulator C-terminal domain-containing protein [Devosia sp. LjRoot16]|uniref:TetR/AcrR family transcriptional regulator n=1 Tax=unclassified Devosia TaxID=196773 RepID=UPI0006F340F8|nr:TetR/AcrR family transcriptional regulator [Devosia sp. Root105]KQU94172.1 TetR family transcriptional regulator [Devosia sp. Root105]
MHSTKRRMIDVGLQQLLQQGYNSLGIQAVLDAASVPKGSFYHHFADKEDFALQVVDAYVADVHAVLDSCVHDAALAPLDRIRTFFRNVENSYEREGYLGCLMGGLGQELSGVSDTFRQKIEWCFSSIADRLQLCLDAAKADGSIAPDSDTRELAELLVNCWEGAALRSRLKRNPAPLAVMLEFYLASLQPR